MCAGVCVYARARARTYLARGSVIITSKSSLLPAMKHGQQPESTGRSQE